ncbi:Putative glycosyltransferase EpsD [Rosistilla oblonga]|uniref:glycosyltransferase family 4 protein n=1 Tax=Rosistilla oblonga TaxID=2527990 RepID=UPI00118CE35F|nr:Putative glycosyltransferase EpsD [Rosistilla oblonga]
MIRLSRRPQPRNRRGPLKTMFVITSMPVGGAETLLVNMIDRFDRNRIVPEVCCLKEPGPLGEAIRDRVEVHSHLLTSKFDPRTLPRLISLFRRQQVDAVVTVGAGDKMFWGRLAAWFAGVPVIASALHSTGWPDGVGRLNRLLTPITSAFIGVAASHADYLREQEGFPDAKVFAIRNGVDVQRFAPDPDAASAVREELQIPSDAPLGIIVAALRPEKNHAMYVDVARRVSQQIPGSHWLIVGDGPERPAIEAACSEAGVSDRVHLLGTRHDTPRLLAASNLFLLCSHNEASPVSILEALACQTPVLSTDVGSVKESVRQGETGFLVPPGDAAAMAQHAVELLQTPQLADRLGKAGRELVVGTGSLEAMVDGYESLIQEQYDRQVHSPQASWMQWQPLAALGSRRARG